MENHIELVCGDLYIRKNFVYVMQDLADIASFSLRQLKQSIHLGRVDFPLC